MLTNVFGHSGWVLIRDLLLFEARAYLRVGAYSNEYSMLFLLLTLRARHYWGSWRSSNLQTINTIYFIKSIQKIFFLLLLLSKLYQKKFIKVLYNLFQL